MTEKQISERAESSPLGRIVRPEEIADMGFKEYNYLENAEPTKFLEVMFGDIKLDQHQVVKAGLRSIIKSRMDAKISVIHGQSAVGKSTGLTILGMILGDEYHFTTTELYECSQESKSHIRKKHRN